MTCCGRSVCQRPSRTLARGLGEPGGGVEKGGACWSEERVGAGGEKVQGLGGREAYVMSMREGKKVRLLHITNRRTQQQHANNVHAAPDFVLSRRKPTVQRK